MNAEQKNKSGHLNDVVDSAESNGSLTGIARNIGKFARTKYGKATGFAMMFGLAYGFANKLDYNPKQGPTYGDIGDAVVGGDEDPLCQ